jgi:CheY-like chemotaxis protein
VLIADDDPAVVRALSVRCKKLGLEVETAENGLQAILKATRNPPRLLILDINMPEGTAFAYASGCSIRSGLRSMLSC